MTLEVGQELWFVPSDTRYISSQSRIVRVESIGRKWAHLDEYGYKIDRNTLWVDGGKYSSPGRCWPSKAAWEAEKARLKAWDDLTSRLGHRPPDHVNIEMIETIKRMIFGVSA